MKTVSQKRYEESIVRGISFLSATPQQWEDAIKKFMNNCGPYYDLLCDNLYQMSTNPSGKQLWLHFFGYTYLSASALDELDICILSQEELPVFDGDIDFALNLFCARIDRMNQLLVRNHKYKNKMSIPS